MNLAQSLKTDLISALKEKRETEVSTLRMLQAAIKNREIESKKREEGLTDEEVVDVVMKEAKKRKDAIEAYQKGGRQDLADKETAELKILEKYLPQQLNENEIRKEVENIIKEVDAKDAKDIGKVMRAVIGRLKGRAEGGMVSSIVKETLSKLT